MTLDRATTKAFVRRVAGLSPDERAAVLGDTKLPAALRHAWNDHIEVGKLPPRAAPIVGEDQRLRLIAYLTKLSPTARGRELAGLPEHLLAVWLTHLRDIDPVVVAGRCE
jgi:hypothetical protein